MTTQTQHDLAPANQPEFELTVTPVPDEQRIDFWPQYFGAIPQWLLLEPHIFAWMDRFCEGYIRSPKMTQSVLLPPGPFTRRQAQAVTTTYSNITLEDDQGSHFRLVVRDTEGRMVWRAWNFEPDAGEGLNRYIRTSGIRTDTATR